MHMSRKRKHQHIVHHHSFVVMVALTCVPVWLLLQCGRCQVCKVGRGKRGHKQEVWYLVRCAQTTTQSLT